jgi:hypothetical protein
MLLAIAACITRGWKMPDRSKGVTHGRPANVIFITTEDTRQLIKARMIALGCDLKKVRVITATEAQVLLPGGMNALEALIASYPPALLVLDPLDAILDDKINLEKATDMRRVITSLTRMAVTWHMAVTLVQHKTKRYSNKLLTQGIGSVAIGGGARFAFNIAPTNGVKVVKSSKNNWAKRPDDLCYRIEPATVEQVLPGGEIREEQVSKVIFVDKPGKDVVPAAQDDPAAKDQAKVIEALRATGEWMTRKALAKATDMMKTDGQANDALINALTALVAGTFVVEQKGKRGVRHYSLPVEG